MHHFEPHFWTSLHDQVWWKSQFHVRTTAQPRVTNFEAPLLVPASYVCFTCGQLTPNVHWGLRCLADYSFHHHQGAPCRFLQASAGQEFATTLTMATAKIRVSSAGFTSALNGSLLSSAALNILVGNGIASELKINSNIQQKAVTPLKAEAFDRLLHRYPEQVFVAEVVSMLNRGASIGCCGPQHSHKTTNDRHRP